MVPEIIEAGTSEWAKAIHASLWMENRPKPPNGSNMLRQEEALPAPRSSKGVFSK
jgi:hypothetical protein